jgi:hypothetical protein
LSSWKDNHGNRILGSAILVAILACGSWYFDLLPNISLVPTNSTVGSNTTLLERPTVLVLAIVPPAQLNGTVNGYAQLYPPSGILDAESIPALSRKFSLSSGAEESIWIQEIRSGDFTAVVYLDINANEKLDFSADGTPAEPFLVSGPSKATTNTNLEAGGFSLLQNQLQVLLFQF